MARWFGKISVYMRQIIKGILIIGGVFSLCACSPTPPAESAEHFITALDHAGSDTRVRLADLQQLDPLLLRPASLYPQLSDFSLPVLSALYQYHQYCTGSLDRVPVTIRYFELALCEFTPLPVNWFATHPISPLGGSHAWHYLLRHPDEKDALQTMLHVRERPDALGGIGQLSDDNLDALANGQTWLLQNDYLWRLHQRHWVRYAPEVWHPLAQRTGITLLAAGAQCDIPLGALCVIAQDTYVINWSLMLISMASIAGLSLFWLNWQRRRAQRRELFIVQMLTHELRTPIARLGNVVEYFRRDVDRLPPELQRGFGELADSVLSMRQMAEASRNYLSSDNPANAIEVPSSIWLSEWLNHIVGVYPGLTFCLDEEREVVLPLYWSSLCLKNLLDNAFCHGLSPVRLTAICRNDRLTLCVTDAGMLKAGTLHTLSNSSSRQSGMGLGLTIVSHIAKQLKGQLTLNGPPTMFILELPCDTQKSSLIITD